MLGRYIAGTCLILGVAMVVTPDTRERKEPQVSRAQPVMADQRGPQSVPASLTTPPPAETELALSAPSEPGLVANEQVLNAALEGTLTPEPLNGEIGGIATLAGLKPEPTGTVERRPQAEPAASRSPVLFVSGSRVNVRSGPSTQYGVINSVQYGDAVEVVAYEADGWAQIRIGGSGEIGYMADRFLQETLNGG